MNFTVLKIFLSIQLFISFSASSETEKWPDIQKSVQDKMLASKVSGLQLSYYKSDGSQKDFNFGTLSSTDSKPINNETRFFSASLTKMFTAIALFQLREQGLLQFDQKIVDHFQSLKNSVDPQMQQVTIRQIMSHTSGMARNGELFWTSADLISKQKAPSENDVFSAALNQRFGVPFDTQLKYSNLGYELLGLLVGKLCKNCEGKSLTSRYESYIKRNILSPLKMNLSGFNPSNKLSKKFATPYKLINAEGLREPFSLIHSAGASVGGWGLYSTSKDMLKFIVEIGKIASKKENLLLTADVSAEITNGAFKDHLNSSFEHSLGFRLVKITDGHEKTGYLIGHTGTFPGYSSAAFYNTIDKSSSVVFFNVVDGGGLGYLMLLATPLSGIKQVAGKSEFLSQPESEALPGNPFSSIVKKWKFIYGPIEVIFENDRYFFLQSGQKIPLYLKMDADQKSISGRLGTNAGYLDFLGDSIKFFLDENGECKTAYVANAILLTAN